jgi:hypothetical protein
LTLALLIGYGIAWLISPEPSMTLAQEMPKARIGEASQLEHNTAIVDTNGDYESQREGDSERSGDTETDGDIEEDRRHRECIYVRGISGFGVIDDKHLTVSTSPRRTYLVTLRNRCRDLRWAHQIAIKSFGSWTCSHSRDVVLVGDQRCMIQNIERVGSKKEAIALVEERKDKQE